MHGGTLTATSAGEGRGSHVHADAARWPSARPRPRAAEPGRPIAGTSAATLDVLVIEDNEDVAETLTMLLEELGHRVSLARTGRQRRGAGAGDRSPNVVLCDIGLPEMDGLEVCRQIRALPTKTRPIMVARHRLGARTTIAARRRRPASITTW